MTSTEQKIHFDTPEESTSPRVGDGLKERIEPPPIIAPDGRELTYGERFTKDGFWVFDYLQGIGYTKNLRELAQMEGIDFDAGLEDLRRQGFLDESDPEFPEVILP